MKRRDLLKMGAVGAAVAVAPKVEAEEQHIPVYRIISGQGSPTHREWVVEKIGWMDMEPNDRVYIDYPDGDTRLLAGRCIDRVVALPHYVTHDGQDITGVRVEEASKLSDMKGDFFWMESKVNPDQSDGLVSCDRLNYVLSL